jgi:NAD(P)-dependent dehydrogenase (short-subunit alcohol dehydrogenase family)
MSDLADKVVLLTGASRGIGAATAAVLGRAGASLIAHYAGDRDGVERATAGIPDERRLLLEADFSEPGAGRRLWADAIAWRGRVDVLVNNAATMAETGIDDAAEDWDAAWRRMFQVNVHEPANLMREAVRSYRDAGGGIVITMSSWAAQQGSSIASLTGYAATKAAVKAVTQTLARAHAREGILTYVIAPGIVDTEMSRISVTARGSEEAVMAILPLGEMVPPQEVAELVAFLASGTCRHLSGATLDINGAAYVR